MLTRQLRELWVVGPLKPAGEGDDAARESVRQDAETAFAIMNRARGEQRQPTGEFMKYQEEELQGSNGTV